MFGDRLGHLTEESLELPLPLGGDLSFLGRFQAGVGFRVHQCQVFGMQGLNSAREDLFCLMCLR